jgi:glycosyltransferase involved in cell wall biosynthesis
MKVLLDVTDSSHSLQHSGIPQVVRNLYKHFPASMTCQPVVLDRYFKRWRMADARERRWLEPEHHVPEAERGKVRRWSDGQKLRGWLGKWLPMGLDNENQALPLIAPELFYPDNGHRFNTFRRRGGGPRLAIFHDAVALEHPEFFPAHMVCAFPGYLRHLATFDGVAAVSEASLEQLRRFWEAEKVSPLPAVRVIPLGTHVRPQGEVPGGVLELPEVPDVLCVSTIEPRKNHERLLQAAEQLWAEGLSFRLTLVGGCNAEVREAWLARVRSVKAPDGCFRYLGKVSDEALRALYKEVWVSVYPSLWEGFGLPVIESLSYGKPCLCSDRGGLAEVAAGGGCLLVDPESVEALAKGLRRLCRDLDTYTVLQEETRGRTFRSWAEYAADVCGFMQELSERNGGS